MRYIRFRGSTPYCGTAYDEVEEFDDSVTDEELDEISEDKRLQNAESYEYLATGWGDDFETEEEREQYYEDCEGSWEIAEEGE